MSTYMKGICCTLLSAVIFGFTPILVRIAYEGGANSITITFLRAWLALPLLYALMHRRHIPLRLEDSQVKHVPSGHRGFLRNYCLPVYVL